MLKFVNCGEHQWYAVSEAVPELMWRIEVNDDGNFAIWNSDSKLFQLVKYNSSLFASTLGFESLHRAQTQCIINELLVQNHLLKKQVESLQKLNRSDSNAQ